jgi:multiple sugar transport system ATP-binding protein
LAPDIDEEAKDARCRVAGEITSLLPVGSDRFIGVRCADEPMFFRVGKERSFRVGERVSNSLNRRRCTCSIRQAA